MNENINLCEILKGHEGETFYSEILEEVELYSIIDNKITVGNGKLSLVIPNCHHKYLFPSKDQRDWNKWDKENNLKTPKTWQEYCNYRNFDKDSADYAVLVLESECDEIKDGIIKSSIALLKIYQLIEVGYGGNVSNEEWHTSESKWCITCFCDKLNISNIMFVRRHIAFHTKEQAEEFLSYEENVQLLKDYFMI